MISAQNTDNKTFAIVKKFILSETYSNNINSNDADKQCSHIHVLSINAFCFKSSLEER